MGAPAFLLLLALFAVVTGIVVLGIRARRTRHSEAAEATPGPLFVLMLREYREPTASEVELLAERAWADEPKDRGPFVWSQDGAMTVLEVCGNAFTVSASPRPWAETGPQVSAFDGRTEATVPVHAATLVIGLAHACEKSEARLRRLAERLAAEFVDDNCLGVLSVDGGHARASSARK